MIEMRTRTGRHALLALVIGFAWALPARAQTAVESLSLAAAFGTGVHAYFSGDYDRTVTDLGAIIAAGSRDPRAHYFRGLALLRMGRTEEAEADFSDGAELETRDLGTWSVSRSLERVQGADRLQLERHRMRARVAMIQRDRDAVRARQEAADSAQTDVVRERRPVPALPPGATESNPFVDGDGEEPPPTTPAADAPADSPDAESAEMSTEDVGAVDEPRPDDAADVAAPAEETAAPAEEEMEESSPVRDGDAAPAGTDDPFGDSPASDPASTPAEKLPDDTPAAAEAPPAADSDPVEDPAAPAEAPAAAADGDPEMDAGDTEPAADEAAPDEADTDEADTDEADADEADADEADADEADGLGTEPGAEQ